MELASAILAPVRRAVFTALAREQLTIADNARRTALSIPYHKRHNAHYFAAWRALEAAGAEVARLESLSRG